LALANAQRDLQKNREMFNQRGKVDVRGISNIVGQGKDSNINVQKATQFRNEINSILQKSFDPQTASKISEQFKINLSSGIDSDSAIRNAVSSVLVSDLNNSEQAFEKLKNTLGTGEIGDKLRNLASEIASGKIDDAQFTRAIDGIKELNLGIGQDLTQAANTARGKIDELNTSINNLGGVQQVQPQANQEARAFAVGGKVFTPKGTDTVPAMLTPGEFVVNAKSTRQNLPLLKSINNGTNYLANGGMVGPTKEILMYPQKELDDVYGSSILDEKTRYQKGWIYRNFGDLGANQDPLEIIDFTIQEDRDLIKNEISKLAIPKAPNNSESFFTLSPRSNNFSVTNDLISKAKNDYNNDVNNWSIYDEISDNYIEKIRKSLVRNSRGVKAVGRGATNAAIGVLSAFGAQITQFLKSSEWETSFPRSYYKSIHDELNLDQDSYAKNVLKWFDSLNKYKEDIKAAKNAENEAAKLEAEQPKRFKALTQIGSATLGVLPGLGQAFMAGAAPGAQAALEKREALKRQEVKMREGRFKKSSEITGYGEKGQADYIKFGLAKDAISAANAPTTQLGIREQDQYFLGRKGTGEDLQRILLQRQAQAQTLVGVLAEYEKDPNSDIAKIDPQTLFNNGQAALNNLIAGQKTGISVDTLNKLGAKEAQSKIIESYLKLNSFQKASETKGQDFIGLFNTFGEAVKNDPEKIKEQLLKIKQGNLGNDISAYKEFVYADAEGKIEYFKLLKLFTDKYKISDERIKKFAKNKDQNILDKITEFERSKEQTSIKRVAPDEVQGTLDNATVSNFPFNFNDATIFNRIPQYFDGLDPQDAADLDNRVKKAKVVVDKTESINQFFSKFGDAGVKSIYGLTGYPIDKNTGFEKLKVSGGLLQYVAQLIDSKKSAKDPSNFNRSVRNVLLDNELNNQKLQLITAYIRGQLNVAPQVAPKDGADVAPLENGIGIFGVPNNAKGTRVGALALAIDEEYMLSNLGDLAKNLKPSIQDQLNLVIPRARSYFKFETYGSMEPANLKETDQMLIELEYLKKLLDINKRAREAELGVMLPEEEPQQQAKGGLINYLAGGGVPSHRPNPDPSFFKPKGTDTVPAMLTPGEFVVRRDAAQANLPLLHAINSGSSYFASGGSVGGSNDTIKVKDPELQEKVDKTKKEVVGVNDVAKKIKQDTNYLKTVVNEIYNQDKTIPEDIKGIVLDIRSRLNAKGFAKGGGVGFETDTVPAMLTPGEFVVNKNATSKNLSLLKSINNGTNYLSKGGIAYLYGGGLYKTRSERKAEKEKNAENFRDAVTSYWAGKYGFSYYDKNPEKFSEDVKNATNLAAKAAGAGNVDPMARMMANQITSSGLPGADAQESAARQALSGAKIGIFSAETEDVEAMQKMLEDKKSLREEIRNRFSGVGFTRPLGTPSGTPPGIPPVPPAAPAAPAEAPQLDQGINAGENIVAQIKDRLGINNLMGNEQGLTVREKRAIQLIKRQRYINIFGKTPEQDTKTDPEKRNVQQLLDTVLPLASGGNVPGYGNSDSVPAMLTPGEFVVNKNAVSRFGLSNLNKINRYANGGLVGYYQNGGIATNNSASMNIEGFTSGVDKFSTASSQFSIDMNKFNTSLASNISGMNSVFSDFNEQMSNNINALAAVVSTIPSSINGNIMLDGNVAFSVQQDLQAAVDSIVASFTEEINRQIASLKNNMG
jgi:hypothetical protein